MAELEETVKKLLQTIDDLKKNQAAPAPPPVTPDKAAVEKIVDDKLKQQKPLVGWQNGFFLESPDGQHRLRLRGWVQADQRGFIGPGRTGEDNFYLRRVRPIIDATLFRHYNLRLVPDFANSSLQLFDAYVEYAQFPQAVLRAGKFKEPVSLERLQSGPDLHFAERSLSQHLAPNRDVGVQLAGELLEKRLQYFVGAFNGVNDSQSGDNDADSDKDFAARVFYQPFLGRIGHPIQEFGFGLGASVGNRHEALNGQFRTAGRSTFFRYLGGSNPAMAAGGIKRVVPGFYLFTGPFGVMGEYFSNEQEIQRLGVRDTIHNTGYFGQVSYVLTGEKGSFRGVVPRHDFDPKQGHWGAFELAARYSRLDIDSDAFRRGFADRKSAAGGADEYTFGLNWYLNRAMKLQLNYIRTQFDRTLKFGNSRMDHEDVFLSRFQISF